MSPKAPGFREMKPTEIRRLLERNFGYVKTRQNGSHLFMNAPNRQQVMLAIHTKALGPAMVRDILVKQVGLTLDEARKVMSGA